MIKRWLAQRKLAAIVNRNAKSFEIVQFTKNRAAQIKRRKPRENTKCQTV